MSVPTFSAFVATMLTLSTSGGAEVLKSGPQVGERSGTHFSALNITGEYAGMRVSLVYNFRPHAVYVFVRRLTDPALTLVKKLDEEARRSKTLNVLVVFVSQDKDLPERLTALIQKEKPKKAILAVWDSKDMPVGPPSWKLVRGAEVTVVYHEWQRVMANFAFGEKEFDQEAADRVVHELTRLLTRKKADNER